MITREEAIEVIYDLIDSDILKTDVEERLQDIANCIEGELVGRHEWGVDRSKLAKLYGATRIDLVTDKDIEEYDRIHRKLTFVPSVDERIVIESHVRDEIENATGMEAEVEDINDWFRRL